MKQLTFLILGIFGLLLLNSCATTKVKFDYDKSINFSKFKTFEYYGWAENSDQILNQFDKDRIEKAFNNEFKKRDMKLVKSNGDLVVSLYIVTEKKKETTATTTNMGGMYGGYGYGYGYYGYGPSYGWGMGHSTTTYNEHEYTEGTLIIDVFDAKAKRLIWESIGTKTVDENPKTRDESIPKSVAAIMKPYPVQPVKK